MPIKPSTILPNALRFVAALAGARLPGDRQHVGTYPVSAGNAINPEVGEE